MSDMVRVGTKVATEEDIAYNIIMPLSERNNVICYVESLA